MKVGKRLGREREREREKMHLSPSLLTLLMAARSKARAAATSVSGSPREGVLPPAEIWKGERGEGEREGEVFFLAPAAAVWASKETRARGTGQGPPAPNQLSPATLNAAA
jgi:hypothetical protein